MTFSHVVGVLSVGVRMVVRVYVANNLHMNKVKMAAMMMGKMTRTMALRMNGLHGVMMTMKIVLRMNCLPGLMMTMEMVGKVGVEVVSKVVMALMGEMLVAMAMTEAMVWVGGRAMTTMAMMVEVIAAVEVPSASSNQ